MGRLYSKLSTERLQAIRDMNQELLNDPGYEIDHMSLRQSLETLDEILADRLRERTNKRDDCVRCRNSASDVSHDVCVILYGEDYDTDFTTEGL